MRSVGKRATVHDVARAAGTSHATVSRYLNKTSYVSAATAAAIEAAIRDTDYVPNRTARSLVRSRTHAVAFVVRADGTSFFSDPTLNAMAMGANAELSAADYQMMMLIVDSDRSADRIIDIVRGGAVDGVILAAMNIADPVALAMAAAPLPIVATSDPQLGPGVPVVDTDNVGGTRAATLALRRSRSRIAEIRGPSPAPVSGLRHAGFVEAMGSEYRAELSLPSASWAAEDGAQIMQRLLHIDNSIDGVIAASDSLAAGALMVLRSTGRQVPEDVAVIGFDDAPGALHTSPPLTTVRQDAAATGRRCAEILLRMTEGETFPGLRELLPTEIVWRSSAGDPPSP